MNDTELEGRLTAMLERRAADIPTVRPIRFEPSDGADTRPSPAPFAVAAAVAAVLVAVGGTVIGLRTIHHDPTPPVGKQHTNVTATPTPTPTATRACIVSMPQSWQRAITNGRISLDHPLNNVISMNTGTGEYLVEQLRPATAGGPAQVTLAVFHGKTGQDVAEMPTDELTVGSGGALAGATEPLADGSAALTADWIGYGLHHPGSNNGYDTAMLYNRHTQQSIVLDDLSPVGAAKGGQLNSAPILFGGKAYWLEAFYGQKGGVVKSYDLASGTRTSTPVAAAEGLVYYGTGLAVVTRSDQGTALANYAGTALAPAAIQAAADAGYFSYDGTTLRWWNYFSDPYRGILYANRPGTAQVSQQRVGQGMNLSGVTSWPFVEIGWPDPSSPIFDLRTNTLLAVPKGWNVQAVIGDQVLIGTGRTTLGNGGLSLVSLKDLPAVHC